MTQLTREDGRRLTRFLLDQVAQLKEQIRRLDAPGAPADNLVDLHRRWRTLREGTESLELATAAVAAARSERLAEAFRRGRRRPDRPGLRWMERTLEAIEAALKKESRDPPRPWVEPELEWGLRELESEFLLRCYRRMHRLTEELLRRLAA